MNVNALRNRLGGRLRGTVRNLDPEAAVTSGTIPVAARIYWSRLLEGGTISEARFQVITAAGNLCIGFAPNVGTGLEARPGLLIATTGKFACPGSGTTDFEANGDHKQALAAPASLKAGDWVGIAADATTPALRCATGAGAVDTVLASGSAYRETIASGSPVIPTERATLTPHLGRGWLIVGA